MEEKHYTPDIEDLCVGYEYEIELPTGWMNKKSVWQKFVIREGEDFPSFYKDKRDKIRVPYLTKEQIENFGWNYRHTLNGESDIFYSHYFEKELFGFIYGISLNQECMLKITKWNSEMGQSTLFNGKCRCVNDFRKILKLLEIK